MDDLTAGMIKAIGSANGAILALVFQPPVSKRDFVVRSLFSFLSGVLFGDPIRQQYLKWPETWQMWMASAALVALASWWCWGAVLRILGTWKPKP